MRKLFTLLFQQHTLILKAFFVIFCLLGSAETYAQVVIINPPPVILATSTTTLSSTVNPSLVGQPVIITAAVTSPAPGDPTGTVDFIDNATNTDLTPGGVAMSNGLATYQTSALTVNRSFTAKYSGDAANLPSTSAVFTQTISQPAIIITGSFNSTTTTLISSANPTVAGLPVKMTATVSSALNVTGTVDFTDNTDGIDLTPGGIALSNGVAVFTSSSLTPGNLNITATYRGDANNISSTSNSLIQQVVQDISNLGVNLASDINPSNWGDVVKLTAIVTSSLGASAGTVTFADGGNLLGTASLDGSGAAILTTNLLTPGSHSITASYFSITSNVLTQNVNPPFPPLPFLSPGGGLSVPDEIVIDNIGFNIYPNNQKLWFFGASSYGQAVTFQANVSGATGYTPTGSVTFFYGTAPLGTVGLDAGGNAVFTTSILPVGNDNISMSYSGDDVYTDQAFINQALSSPSPSVTLNVDPSATATNVSSSLNPSVSGQQVTFIASVPEPFQGDEIPPTGTVTFYIDGIAQNPVDFGAGNGNIALLNISSLSPGSHTIKATYSGDGNYLTSSSASITQVVGAVGSTIKNFLGSSQSTTVNTAFTDDLTFDIFDINTSLVGGAVITFTAPSSGASGTFSNGTNTITVNTTALGSVGVADSGPFTANGVAGSYTVTASIPGLGTDNFTLTNTVQNVQISIGSSVPGLSFTVDGTAYTTTQTFSWAQGSSHSMATTSTQAGTTGTQYVFTGWSDGTNTIPDNIIVPSTATSYTANFSTQYQLTTAANPSNGGTVSQASGYFYNTGDVVALTATPDAGYVFGNWTGNVASTNAASTSVTMSAPQTITANFNQISATVQVTVGTSIAGLSFTVDGTTYTSTQTLSWFPGDIHSIGTSATQAGGTGTQYVFTNWTNGGGGFVSAPSTATTYTANFSTQYLLTTVANPTNGGIVSPVSAAFYNADEVVPLTATPNAGYVFGNWTGNVASTSAASTSITMSAPQSIAANFTQPATILVTLGTSVPGLSFTVDGTTYTSTQALFWIPGDVHSISTTPTQAGAAGTQYVFTSWNNGGGASQSITASSSTTYIADFKTQYQLTTVSELGPGGSGGAITPVSGSYYDAGSIISVQANPNPGSLFSGFTGDLSGTTNPQNITLDGPKTVAAGYVIDCQLAITTIGIPSAITGTNYDFAIEVSGASGAGSVYFTATGLPGELSISSSTGILSGIPTVPGNSYISVSATDANGCLAKTTYRLNIICQTVTVNSVSNQIVCQGTTTSTVNFSGLPSTGTVFNWTNDNPAIGLAASGTGNINSFIAINNGGTPVTANISVTPSNGSCIGTPASFTITVNPSPVIAPITFSGSTTVCSAATATLTDATSGGTWSTSNNAANVSNAGVVTFATVTAPTIVTIYYTVTTNTCSSTVGKPFTISPPLNVPAITGSTAICGAGGTTTLNDATGGGLWSSGNTAVATVVSTTGVVTGKSTGSTMITYTVSAGGCSAATSTSVSVKALPTVAAISGNNVLIKGVTISLSDVTTSGSWSSSNTAIASVSTSGSVKGISAGTATIYYTVSSGGCSAVASKSITVYNPLSASVTAGKIVCNGSTTTLTVNVTGGSGGYQYSLNAGKLQASNMYTVDAGIYLVVVKDNMAEQFTISGINITQPAALGIKLISETNVSPKGASNGSFTVGGTGGTSPYKYSINGTTYQSSGTFSNKQAGTYTVYVEDACSAKNKISVTVSTNGQKNGAVLDPPSELHAATGEDQSDGEEMKAIVYPNPSIASFILELTSSSKETVEIVVMDMMGHPLYHTRGDATGSYRFGENFIKGMYFVEVIHKSGIKTLKVIKQ